MRILHLTDLHFSGEEKYHFDQNNLRDSLIKSLAQDPKIDFVFFTGDLVFSGKSPQDFIDAKNFSHKNCMSRNQ